MPQRYEDTAQVAEMQVTLYETAGSRHADLLRDEMRLEDQRPGVLDAIVESLIGTNNPATGRPHSASSAADAARTSETYLTHRLAQRNVVHAKNRAEVESQAALLRARIALQQMKHAAGVA